MKRFRWLIDFKEVLLPRTKYSPARKTIPLSTCKLRLCNLCLLENKQSHYYWCRNKEASLQTFPLSDFFSIHRRRSASLQGPVFGLIRHVYEV
jgi:hypothetical protein